MASRIVEFDKTTIARFSFENLLAYFRYAEVLTIYLGGNAAKLEKYGAVRRHGRKCGRHCALAAFMTSRNSAIHFSIAHVSTTYRW